MCKYAFLFLFYLKSTFAFNVTEDFSKGFYWRDFPISISVVEKDSKLKETLEKISVEAIKEWETRTGLSLWDIKNGTKNIIRWSQNFSQETKMDSTTVLAVAIRYSIGPYIAKSEIVINGNHPLNSDISNLITTITHELGHTMGLDHSEEMQAVMAPTLQDPYLGLHEDDVQGMTHIYEEARKRQLTGYISPLAYEGESSSQLLGCGSINLAGSNQVLGNVLSILSGVLIGFIRKILKWMRFY